MGTEEKRICAVPGCENVLGRNQRKYCSRECYYFYLASPEARKANSKRTKQYFKENPKAGKTHGERHRQWFKDNPEARKTHGKKIKQYYLDHPKANRGRCKTWAKRICAFPGCKNEILRKDAKYCSRKCYSNDPEVRKVNSKRTKQWYIDHPEATKAYGEQMKQWFKDHPEAVKAQSKRLKQYYIDNPEAIEVLSKQVTTHLLKHKNDPKLHYYPGLKPAFRSSWEANVFWIYKKVLGLRVKYEPKSFELSNGKNYIPDLYLPETDEYIEVKGRWYPGGKKKLELFRQDYPDINFTVMAKNEYMKLIREYGEQFKPSDGVPMYPR